VDGPSIILFALCFYTRFIILLKINKTMSSVQEIKQALLNQTSEEFVPPLDVYSNDEGLRLVVGSIDCEGFEDLSYSKQRGSVKYIDRSMFNGEGFHLITRGSGISRSILNQHNPALPQIDQGIVISDIVQSFIGKQTFYLICYKCDLNRPLYCGIFEIDESNTSRPNGVGRLPNPMGIGTLTFILDMNQPVTDDVGQIYYKVEPIRPINRCCNPIIYIKEIIRVL
jgi:hypothetical protein